MNVPAANTWTQSLMVDEIRIHRLLAELRRRTGDLREATDIGAASLLGDATELNSVKYLFITAIEAMIDIAQHVCASDALGAPDTNRAAFELLAANGVLDADTANGCSAANGFRNILVHGYADVDDERVVVFLAQLGDFDAFAREIATYIAVGRSNS